MTDDFAPISTPDAAEQLRSIVAELAQLSPDVVSDGTIDVEALRDLLGGEATQPGSEGFGLRWPGMAAARRLSTLPATMTLLPKPEELSAFVADKDPAKREKLVDQLLPLCANISDLYRVKALHELFNRCQQGCIRRSVCLFLRAIDLSEEGIEER